MFDLTKAPENRTLFSTIGTAVPDVQMFQDDLNSLQLSPDKNSVDQIQKPQKPPRVNRSLTQKQIFNENSQNFRAKYEDIPLKRPPKNTIPKPKPKAIPTSQSSTTAGSQDQKTRIKRMTEEYISKTKADINAFQKMYSSQSDYNYPIRQQIDSLSMF